MNRYYSMEKLGNCYHNNKVRQKPFLSSNNVKKSNNLKNNCLADANEETIKFQEYRARLAKLSNLYTQLDYNVNYPGFMPESGCEKYDPSEAMKFYRNETKEYNNYLESSSFKLGRLKNVQQEETLDLNQQLKIPLKVVGFELLTIGDKDPFSPYYYWIPAKHFVCKQYLKSFEDMPECLIFTKVYLKDEVIKHEIKKFAEQINFKTGIKLDDYYVIQDTLRDMPKKCDQIVNTKEVVTTVKKDTEKDAEQKDKDGDTKKNSEKDKNDLIGRKNTAIGIVGIIGIVLFVSVVILFAILDYLDFVKIISKQNFLFKNF